MTNNTTTALDNEKQVRQLVENWAQAVRNCDINAILAYHAPGIVMYDVPPPFQSIGIDAYRKTWDMYFEFTRPDTFDIEELHIVAGNDVAFCYATMKCKDKSATVDYVDLYFRLTIGLKKINNQWTILHEHHSVPSE